MKQDLDLLKQLRMVSDLLGRGDLANAARRIHELKQQHASNGDVWALDGEIAIRQSRLPDAVLAVERAVELEPQNAERRIQQARCLLLAGETERARIAAFAALGFKIGRLDHLLILGGVLVRCNEHQRALEVYLQAESQAPGNADVQRGLASVYRFLGQLDQALAACEQAIALDPHDYEMIGMRSTLRTWTASENHIASLQDLLRSGVRNWRGEVHVAYALAKEHEDSGADAAAFAALQRGAQTKRRHTQYDAADDRRIFTALQQAFTLERMQSASAGHDSDAPFFVLGMPRTGSTLVERIITSHSRVQGLGELNVMSLEMVRMVEEQRAGKPFQRLELPDLAAQLPMRELGERYLAGVEAMRDGRPHFVDKLPLNSLNIGLIHLALPNARIVHVQRHPVDACYAMYKYLFKHGYPFSYDLEELAEYYAAYYQLMAHWRSVLPEGRIYDLGYENLVQDLEAEARKLIAHLGLPWEPACADFHTNRTPSTTGSAAQVRQPLYSSSVGRWRRLERELEPLCRVLRARGVPIDD